MSESPFIHADTPYDIVTMSYVIWWSLLSRPLFLNAWLLIISTIPLRHADGSAIIGRMRLSEAFCLSWASFRHEGIIPPFH